MAVAVDALDEVLARAWRTLCETYDVSAELPDIEELFTGADLASPEQTSEVVLLNMLVEVVGSISRFSPFYRLPARAFGMISVREGTTQRTRWILAPEAARRWEPVLGLMADAVRRNSAVLEAILLVDELVRRPGPDDPCVMAVCACTPARTILINESALLTHGVTCNACGQRFRPTHKPDSG